MFIIMSFSIPTTWWARLVPMMWAVPIFFSIYFYTKTDKYLKFLSLIIVFLLLINARLVGMPRLHHDYYRTLKEQHILNNIAGKHVFLSFPSGIARAGKRTTLHKLDINNVQYTIIKTSECKSIKKFYDANICDKI